MFYSSNSANPFAQIPPSLHLPPHLPPFLGHDGHSIFLHQHQHQHLHHPDLLLNDSGLANLAFIDPISGITISNNAGTTNPQINGHHFSPQINVLPINKKGGKKDRHTKIRTAQGSRDRRVRLSIEIARKFFDLQDTLGFDRASKTIDWLLTKSTNAIKELMLMKHSCSGSGGGGSKSLSSYEVELSGTNIDGVDYAGELQGIVSERMERNVKVQDRVAFHLLARESKARARARERARERTREKMSTKTQINHSEEVALISDSGIPIFNGPLSCSKVCQGIRSAGLIEEDSLVIKRKQSSILSDLENLSKSIASSPTIPKTLDTVGTTTFPSFYAITNMNLLPECEITSKPWEACTNHYEC